MKETLKFILIFFLTINLVSAQESYEVSRLEISSESDDFSPFLWNEHMVFTSERHPKLFLIEYKDSKQNSGVSSLFKAKMNNDTSFSSPEILSKYIQSNHHDGPASFTIDNKYIYYSQPRNRSSSNEARNDENNFSAIYEAEWNGVDWVNSKRLSFIDTNFIYTHPAISADGKMLVFVSNLDGKKGGADLFVSKKVNDVWQEPNALGSQINSNSNEFFPYIHSNGDLYFASNRKGDFDIYKCINNEGSWGKPKALPSPINSKSDDYSFYLNRKGRSGYFSSNRDGVFDLYFFKRPDNEIDCDSLIEESFCYTFPEVSSTELDNSPLVYQWTVNGEVPAPEDQIAYCFPTEGKYDVRLNIYDTLNQKVIFVKEIYEFLVLRVQQPYIKIADEVRVNEWVDLDASGSFLPEITPEVYKWDFGDGEKGEGIELRHKYNQTGSYRISLTVIGAPIDGVVPQVCSYKDIEVTENAEMNESIPFNEPLDLAAFIKLIEYEKLPDDLFYLNLLKGSEDIYMIHLFDTTRVLSKSASIFNTLKDTSQIHVFNNGLKDFSYYYGSSFTIKNSYRDLLHAWGAGFLDASMKNFKYTKLKSDDTFLSPIVEDQSHFSVVLKRSEEPISDFKEKFKEVPGRVGEVKEKYIEGKGYYYVVGDVKNRNQAFSIYSELRHAGFSSIRIKEFRNDNELLFESDLIGAEKTSSYMIELFTANDYLDENDSLLAMLGDEEIITVRLNKKKIAYYVEGGSNFLAAKKNLEIMKDKGFSKALIRKFEYEKLNEDGYYISKIDEGDFTYLLVVDSTETSLENSKELPTSLLGYSISKNTDSLSGKSYYQIDVGKNLPEAVLLAKKLNEDNIVVSGIKKIKYEPLNDDEFYIDELSDGDQQFVLVLGSYKKKQDVYQTFKGFSSCNEIREFYDDINDQFLYIVGGYETLEEVFLEKDKCLDLGMQDAIIQRFVYDPLNPDQFYLMAANEEQEVYRITLNRTNLNDVSQKSSDEKYDALRDEGDLINTYDSETDEYVVALANSRSLPQALSYLGEAIEKGYISAKVQRYIYSSLDHDRFSIRDLNKEDRFACVELFHSDSLLPLNDPVLRKLSRKYPISYSYNVDTKDYVYVIGPLDKIEDAIEKLEMAKSEGFENARIMSMIYKTLQQDEFYLEEMEDIEIEFVITLLQTKEEVDISNAYFDKLPSDVKVNKIYDKNSGFYYYMARDFENIDEANRMFSMIQENGYPNARLEKMKYQLLNPDEFTLETLSELSNDFTISLIRSDEKLGTDHPMFNAISTEVPVYEYYNYNTKKFIYNLGKIEGMVNVFTMNDLAKKYGFKESNIDRFIYSALNPDHFTLQAMDEDQTLFTIVLESSDNKMDKSAFSEIESKGYFVREKYVPGKGSWTYLIGLTDNIAEANVIVEEARALGFENAEISRFKYTPLNEDSYYLTPLEDIETTFMLEIKTSDEKIGVSGEVFEKVNGVYKVREIFDPIEKKYKYYAGNPLEDQEEAEAFRNELILMGYDGVKVSKFIYTALRVDEYYLEEIKDDEELAFVLDLDQSDNKETEKVYEFFIYFGFDQYFLSKVAVEKLKDFYTNHYVLEYEILLEGYTDSTGPAQYNMWLSSKRAKSVKKYLISMGVKDDNITVVAKGETNIIYRETNVEDYKKSRRVLVRSFQKKE